MIRPEITRKLNTICNTPKKSKKKTSYRKRHFRLRNVMFVKEKRDGKQQSGTHP